MQDLARKPELQNGDARRVVLEHIGRKHAGGHLAEAALHGGRYLSDRHVDLDVRMEINLHYRIAVVGLRFDVLDVIYIGREAALETGDDPFLHLLRRQPSIDPEDAHDWDIDIRKNIDRHPNDRDTAENSYDDRHHHERVGATKGEPDYPHMIFRARAR